MVRFAGPKLGRKGGRGAGWGKLGSGNMGKQVEAEDTHCGDGRDACAATRLITARIMPTPGTEIAKASLADSSLVTRLGSPAGQGGDGRAVEAGFSPGQRHTELHRGHQGVKGAVATLTPAPSQHPSQHHLSQACRSKPLLECLDVWAGVSQTDDRCVAR